MTYHVYENWVAEGHKARIHRSDCGYCNNGRGFHPGASSRNGRWHGAFLSLSEAKEAATRTGGNVSFCKHCIRSETKCC